MSFGNPWFLFGLLSIAVPIYLHLYFRRNPTPRDFPSLQLIRTSMQTMVNRLRLRNLLLLALRILLLALLVGAFSRPFWGAGHGGTASKGAPAAFVIAIDNSLSMGASHQGISLFNAAKSKALEVLERMGPYDKAAIAVINEPGMLISPQLSWDKAELKESVRNLPLSFSGTNLASSLQPALKLLSQVRSYRRSLYVITDVTRQSWKPFVDTYDLKRIDPDIDLVLIPVGDGEPDNLAIANLSCEAPVVVKGRSAPIAITVANYGNRLQKSTLSLSIDGDKKWESSVEIGPNTSKRLVASCTFTREGPCQIQAALPGDQLPQDDLRSLSVKVLATPRLLIFHPPLDREGQETRDDLFLRFALNPMSRAEGATFQVERRLPEENTSLPLNQYAAIFLVNQRQLPEALLTKVSEYVLGGGNLVVFLGSRVDPTWYNNCLIDRLGSNYLLPGRLVKRLGNAVSRTVAYQLTDLDTGHPAFRLFAAEENGDPSRAQIFEFFEVEAGPSSMVLAKLNHGLPAVLEERRGQGRVLMVNFSADTAWTDWPLKPTFLPFLHQSLLGMISKAGLSHADITPGNPVSMNVREAGLKRVLLTTPSGKTQELPLRRNSGPMIPLSITGTDEAGFYQLTLEHADGTRQEAFTVNPPPEESNLDRYDLKNIPRFVPLKTRAGDQDKLGDRITVVREGRELTLPFLTFLLLLTLVETILANRAPGKGVKS